MTANEDAIDLDAIEDALRTGRHVPMRTLYTLIAELRSTRASIGPDSERIRELEAEVERLSAELRIVKNPGAWSGPS